MNQKPPLHRIVDFLLNWIDRQRGRVRFQLEQKRKARTTIESYALTDSLNFIEGRPLPRPDIQTLADLGIAIHESAINNFIALYGEQEVIILGGADKFLIDYQAERQRIVLQPGDPLAVITLRG